MPTYDDRLFSPAAPVVYAKLRHSPESGPQSDVPMLIDSGADVSLIPKSAVDFLILKRSNTKFELEAFDGAKTLCEAVHAELLFLGKIFRGQFLIIDQEIGILGRDILNHLCILLDGPNLQWREQTSLDKT